MEYSRKIEFGPLYEAYEAHNQCCGLCIVRKAGEEKYLRSVLDGELLIRPEMRKTLIAGRFCANHLEKLFAVRDKLGLALLLSGYLKTQSTPKKALGIRAFILDRLRGTDRNGCSICTHILNQDQETIEKLLILLQGDEKFCSLFQQNFFLLCHKHYSGILTAGQRVKGFAQTGVRPVVQLQTQALEKIQRDLKWFIQKFNYKNREAPWHDSRDSLKRVIEYLQ